MQYQQEHSRGSIVESQGLHQDGLNFLSYHGLRPQFYCTCYDIFNYKRKEIEIKSSYSWNRITRLAYRSYIRYLTHGKSLFAQIQMKSISQVKLCQVGVGSNIAQNHFSSPREVIYGHYLPLFT